jgi:hypothetical protein
VDTRTPAESVPSTGPLQKELLRYGDELLPGAAEELIALWADELDGLTTDRLAEEVAMRLEDPEVAERFVCPRTYEAGGALSPLRRVLQRHAQELKPGALATLARHWRIEMRKWSLPRIAGEVERRLHSPEYVSYRRDHPCPEDRVREALGRFADDLIPEAVDTLTRRWAAELLPLESAPEITAGIVARLLQPAFAGYFQPDRALPRSGEAMLRTILRRHGDQLRRGAESELYRLWLPLASGQQPTRVAAMVVRSLADPRFASYLRSPSDA